MHRENFFKPLESIMSRWKWRASWGRTGNNNLSVANSRGEYKITDTNYQGSVGILNTTLKNSQLRWETTESYDIGVDLGFFNNRLGLLIDYFNKLTFDRLYDEPLWNSTGVSSIKSNYGSVRNSGIEIELNATPIQTKDFSWDLSLTFAYNKGIVVDILPRKNALVRPAVANVDQALVIFAGTSPKPNLNLLDRFLLMMEQQNVPTLICFNKEDLASVAEIQELRDANGTCGYPLFFVSARQQEGIEPLRAALEGKTTTVAGPSGVGKSTLINLLAPEVQMETGEISEKIQRGKHTTRHSQLILLNEQTYIFDTPGFSSLAVDFFEKETLGTLFPEFVEYEQNCRFTGCSHIGEPVCGVKEALAEGKISQSRYNNYVQIYNELIDNRKY